MLGCMGTQIGVVKRVVEQIPIVPSQKGTCGEEGVEELRAGE